MIILADTDHLDAMMKGIGKDLMPRLRDLGKMSAQEIQAEANKRHVKAEHLPYVFWVLASHQDFLSSLGPLQKVFVLMIDLMARTGTMPNYQRALLVPNDPDAPQVDAAVDALAKQIATWAARTLVPYLVKAYYDTLLKWAPQVPKASDKNVTVQNAFRYLDGMFREILFLRSAWFDDGELLRRAVRFIPAL